MDNNDLLKNIIKICAQRGIAPTRACIDAGVGKSFLSHIRDGQTPSVAKIAQLAAFLGCSTSDLVGDAPDPDKEKKPAGESDGLEAEFMDRLRELPEAQKLALLSLLRQMTDRG